MTEHYIVHQGHVACSLGVMHEGYLPDFLMFANTIEVTQGVRLMPPVGMPEEREWVQNLAKRKQSNVIFAVLVHEPTAEGQTYRYIGHTGIHAIKWPDGTAVTGTLLGNSKNWLQGYGTEAKLLLLFHAFQMLGLRKLTSEVKAFNARSLGHLLKCGYRIIGRYTKQDYHYGSYVDRILLEVFREDWKPIWDAYQADHALPKLTEEQRTLIGKETGLV